MTASDTVTPTDSPAATRRGWWRRCALGDGDPRWARPALWALLAATAALYLVDLSSSGSANDFYAASVKSATQSVKAWFFASLDSGNAITVDKPPADIWLMGLSVRIFGFSSFAMLLPQALSGVAAVGVLYGAVRRVAGHAAGLLAGVLLAVTPVAVLMFRFNNPDSLLTLLLTLAGYFVVRAVAAPAGRRALFWLIGAGVALGFAFLTKMLEGWTVVPALALGYLIAGRARLWTRVWHLLVTGAAMLVAAGWYVVLVAVWPADARPYIGGSTDNSLWQLAIGYNGLSRIFGQGGGAAPGGGGGFGGRGGGGGGFGGFGGATGITRLFSAQFAGQISFLLPAALLALVAGLVVARHRPRTDPVRASLIIWGGGSVVTGLVFSYMSGIIHPYYTIAMAPGLAATLAIAGAELWRRRATWPARLALVVVLLAGAGWSAVVLHRGAPGWSRWLPATLIVAAVVAALVIALAPLLRPARLARTAAVTGLVLGLLAGSGASIGYALSTAAQPHTGSTPSAGPAGSGGSRGGFGGGPGGFGGGASSPDAALVALLNATTTRWSAAVSSDQTAAGDILATHTAVMAIGGWSGSDPSPTLAQFESYVATGQISYYVAGGRGGFGGGRGGSSTQIADWVSAHFTARSVGGVNLYDLRSQA